MIDRRKFLERSVLSTGSVLFSSALLQSCTKYGIPLPGGGTNPGGNTPPPLLGSTIDWNDDAKIMVTSFIEMIPLAGDLLGGLADILWPSTQEDVWGEIKDQVEALVDQKIDATIYTLVYEDLKGLRGQITLYLNEVKNGTPSEILSQWMTAISAFVGAKDHFQSVGNELPLLPLFAQFANLYLALLRDGATSGLSWGRTADDHTYDLQNLQDTIIEFITYTMTTYNTGGTNLANKTEAGNQNIEPFKTLNTYERQMIQTVLCFADLWQFYDVNIFPNGVPGAVPRGREIYSDPFGSAADSGPIFISPLPPPSQFPTNVTVWAWDRLDAVQLTYPANSGPGKNTTTPRMGDQPDGQGSGGSNQAPRGGSFDLSPDNPITAVRAQTASYYENNTQGPLVAAVQFQFHDGSTTNLMGSLSGAVGNHDDTNLFGYFGQALSSIHVNGVNKQIGSADCIVFGFQDWQSPAATLRAISAIYVKSPKERSVADFAKAFPKLAIPSNLITEELKAARKAYWESIKARAEEIK